MTVNNTFKPGLDASLTPTPAGVATMTVNNTFKQPELPVGISGLRELKNQSYPPNFISVAPENWILEEYKLQNQNGQWIALKGPVNQSIGRFTSLDIYMIQPDSDPRYQSLESYASYTRKQELMPKSKTLAEGKCEAGGVVGYEIKIITPRVFTMAQGPVDAELVKQWCILIHQGAILQVMYEAPLSDFEQYYQAYDEFLKNLSFLP